MVNITKIATKLTKPKNLLEALLVDIDNIKELSVITVDKNGNTVSYTANMTNAHFVYYLVGEIVDTYNGES